MRCSARCARTSISLGTRYVFSVGIRRARRAFTRTRTILSSVRNAANTAKSTWTVWATRSRSSARSKPISRIFSRSYAIRCVFHSSCWKVRVLFSCSRISGLRVNRFSYLDELISFESRLDDHIDFLKNEVEIKIQSVKIELDDICESFKNELNDVKVKLKQ